jgi:hypothetical protein
MSLPQPQVGGLSVAKTGIICQKKNRRSWETLRASKRSVEEILKYISGIYLVYTTAE